MKKGYPATGYPPEDGYSQPPPEGSYRNLSKGYHPLSPPPPPPPPPSSNFSIVRCLVICTTTALVLAGTLSILILFIIQPEEPILNVDNIIVSNFTIINSRLSANWDLSLKMWNTNVKFDMYCDEIVAFIFYKRFLLANSTMKSFLLGKKQETKLEEKLESHQEPVVESHMEEDRENGVVELNVGLTITAKYQNRGGSVQDQRIIVVCEKLGIYFQDIINSSVDGNLGPGPWICLVHNV